MNFQAAQSATTPFATGAPPHTGALRSLQSMENTNITDEEMKLIESCQSAEDRLNATQQIKDNRGGCEYPADWWQKVKLSGLMDKVMARWGRSSELKVTKL